MSKKTFHYQATNPHYTIDVKSFDALCNMPSMLDKLIECYMAVFSQSPGPSNTHARADVIKNLKRQLSGVACLRISIDIHSLQVIGFCWAQRLNADQVYSTSTAMPDFKEHEQLDSRARITELAESDSFIYLHELGVREAYRNQVDLVKLATSVLEDIASRAQTRQVIFWTVAQTCAKRLAERASIYPKLAIDNLLLFVDKLPLRDTTRLHQTLDPQEA